MTFQNARIIKEVWIADTSGYRSQLKRLSLSDMRELYANNTLAAITRAAPLYWVPGVTMLAPSQLAETAATFVTEGLTDYDLIVFSEDYLNKSIYVMPPVAVTTTVEVLASWYSKTLSEDTDVCFWSQYPELLVRAARSEIEVDLHRNTQGRRDFDTALLERVDQLNSNMVEEEQSGPSENFVIGGA